MIRAALALFAFLAVGSSSFATSLSPIQAKMISPGVDRMLLIDGNVVDVKHANPKCGPPKPGADPCINITTISIGFHLGCLDDVAVSHVATFNRRSNKIVVDVTALQMANEKSRRVKCARENVKYATILVKNDLDHVEAKDVRVVFQKRFTDVR